MNKSLEALAKLKKLGLEDTDFKPYTIEELDILDARQKHNQKVEKLSQQIEKSLKKQVENEIELQVFKLAYEWKCNGVDGTYEELLDQARKTVEGWKEIERKGYGTIIED